jgi:AcrR family transcriptional regulator
VPRSDSRLHIVTCAWNAIAEVGIRGLRVEDVATRAGVATSLIYYYFHDRAGLLRATMEYSNSRAPSTTFESLDVDTSAYDRLKVGLLKEFDGSRAVKKNAIVWGEITAAAAFDQDIRVQIGHDYEAWTAAIEKIVLAGQDDGSIRTDINVRDEVEHLTSLLEGLSVRWVTSTLTRKRAIEILEHSIRQHLATKDAVRKH